MTVATPMGFAASAGWAQRVTDRCTQRLPPSCRLVDSQPVPQVPPVWGSILDDVWGFAEVIPGAEASTVPEWARLLEDDLGAIGVSVNEKKNVTGDTNAELQGALLNSHTHELGLSPAKRGLLFKGILRLVCQRAPARAAAARAIGKLGFAEMFRPCIRSVHQEVYRWLLEGDQRRLRRLRWCPTAWAETLCAALLLPLARVRLDRPWCSRVVASDASPGGHGLAWAASELATVQKIAQACSHRGAYTSLELPEGLKLDGLQRCPLARVDIGGAARRWFTAARRGGYSHITLEEANAFIWGLRSRLLRPQELGTRIIHPCDSAAWTGAVCKGRSASRKLNGRCRQAAGILLAADLECFVPWVESAKNPADAPSSRFGIRALKGVDLAPAKEVVIPSEIQNQRALFVHLCSGPRRTGDVHSAMVRAVAGVGFDISVLSVDPYVDRSYDLLDNEFFAWLYSLCCSSRVVGGLAAPRALLGVELGMFPW